MKLKIGAKMTAGFMGMVLLLVVVGLAAYINLKNVADSAEVISKFANIRYNSVSLARYVIHQQDSVTDYSLTKNPEVKNDIIEDGAHVRKQHEILKNLITDKEILQVLGEFEKRHRDFETIGSEMSAYYVQGRQGEANAAMKKFDALSDAIEKDMAKLEEYANKNINEAFNHMASAKTLANIIIVTVSLLSIVFGLFLGVFLSRSFSRPIVKLSHIANQVAEGDLAYEIDIKRNDEIGTLAEAFKKMSFYLKGMAKSAEEIAEGNLGGEITPKSEKDVLGNSFKKMTLGLRNIVTEMRSGADQISSASTQLASTSEETARNNESGATAIEQITSTMHEMSANIKSVAKNTQNQASSVTETSASIEQMVISIQRIAVTAQQLVELSLQNKKMVGAGLEAMDKSLKSTDEINKAITRSADTITVLGSRAEDIGKIVDVIDDLAEQTNLLALNAAIEAARAGEQGLGFAVVAEEVRKLAERSAKSTREISELITGIQKEALEAVKLMDKSIQMVEKGVELSKQVGGSLKDIENSVVEVDRYSREIGAATQEQSGGSTQIAKAAENLREITQEIMSSMEEQASAAEQTVKTMEKMREMVHQNASASTELASSAEQLSSQAERFQQIVGRFELDGSEKRETGLPPKGSSLKRTATAATR